MWERRLKMITVPEHHRMSSVWITVEAGPMRLALHQPEGVLCLNEADLGRGCLSQLRLL